MHDQQELELEGELVDTLASAFEHQKLVEGGGCEWEELQELGQPFQQPVDVVEEGMVVVYLDYGDLKICCGSEVM